LKALASVVIAISVVKICTREVLNASKLYYIVATVLYSPCVLVEQHVVAHFSHLFFIICVTRCRSSAFL